MSNTEKRVRGRFAPSPTGPLHIGGVRTALYCYLFCKKHNGDFILRLEDTDQNRFVQGAEDYIKEALRWMGLNPDEGPGIGGSHGPYKQSERKALYQEQCAKLIENGTAYYAFDTPAELEEMRENLRKQGNPAPQYNSITRQYMKNSLSLSADEVKRRLDAGDPHVVRLKLERNEEIKFHDEVRGWVTFNSSQLDDKVLMKGDGMPTYHLANVIDDKHMEITHVIRGEEWLSSTPTHVMLYRAFGWENDMPIFAHLPLILKPDGKGKLSKRDGDRLGIPVFPLNWTNPETGEKSSGFKERGFLPKAMVNWLAFLGWNPGTNQELFEKEDLIKAFSLEQINKSGARFDFKKGTWFNHQYIKNQSSQSLAEELEDDFKNRGWTTSVDELAPRIELMKDRVNFKNEFVDSCAFFFESPKSWDEKSVRKKWSSEAEDWFSLLINGLEKVDFGPDDLETFTTKFMEDHALKMGQVFPLIRLAVMGQVQGPPVYQMMALTGKDLVLKRLRESVPIFHEIKASADA